jgi:long-chain acyl-CoA synthetase
MQYPYQHLYEIITNNAKQNPKKIALIIDKLKISNQKLLEHVDRFAHFLIAKNIGPGDKVAMIVANSSEFIISYFAISKIGAVIVPINTMLKADEFNYILNDCEAKLLICSAKFHKETGELYKSTPVQNVIWIDEIKSYEENYFDFATILEEAHTSIVDHKGSSLDDVAVILYTSGTTGKPKGAMLSNRNLFANMIDVRARFDFKKSDRFIVFLPMFHAFTLMGSVLVPLYISAPIVVIKNLLPFSNIVKQTLLKRVTVFIGVPDIFNALIRAKLPWYFMWFNKIRIFVSGASALSQDTLEKYQAKFTRAKMIEGYGLSECAPGVAINSVEKQIPLSVGPALDSIEAKIVNEEMMEVGYHEVGELIVKGDNVMLGYLNKPEATAQTIINGWLRTGDLAKMDEDGNIYIVDRIKDLIISKGLNIYPREIEEHLYLLPYVKAAAVVGIKDEHSGEVPIAFVEIDEAHKQPSVSNIKKELKKELANFKLPKHIFFIDELPKNATGKVLKRVLKANIDDYMEA